MLWSPGCPTSHVENKPVPNSPASAYWELALLSSITTAGRTDELCAAICFVMASSRTLL